MTVVLFFFSAIAVCAVHSHSRLIDHRSSTRASYFAAGRFVSDASAIFGVLRGAMVCTLERPVAL